VSSIDSPKSVRPGEELDRAALGHYLEKTFGASSNASSELEIEQFRGGHSNLTYLLKFGGREMILRRPPVGSKVATAHDMGREFRVLSALSAHYPKAPKPLAHEEDHDIIGASFYLMERVRGVILRRKVPAGLELSESACNTLCENLIATLAELHCLDYGAIGLGELGRPNGYVERQVTGWSKRYLKSQTDEIPEATSVAEWLASNQPSGDRAGLIHNDFKFDNLVLDPSSLDVIGILDWEMSTVGDPLMDLGTSLSYWVEASDPAPMIELAFAPTAKPGMWTRAQLLTRYQELTGETVDAPRFYYVFGLFKLAVIVQQIYYRYAKGLTQDPRFATLGQAAQVLLIHAAQSLE